MMRAGIEAFRERHSGEGHSVTDGEPLGRGRYFECVCGAAYLTDDTVVRDASGRLIAPPQPEHAPRPEGPWDRNINNTKGDAQ